jgi:hypothetical protein
MDPWGNSEGFERVSALMLNKKKSEATLKYALSTSGTNFEFVHGRLRGILEETIV